MSHHKRTRASKQGKRTQDKVQIAGPAGTTKTGNLNLDRAMRQIAGGNYPKALSLLLSAGSEWQVRNATGVCLMRLGRSQDAIPHFRAIVLAPGCTWTRPNTPVIYQTNYATALLMSGHPSGCEEILADVVDKSHPQVQLLRNAIDGWVHSLSFWQKLNWRFGRVEPKHCQVSIEFVPGDFEDETVLRTEPQTPRASSTGVTAA